MPGDPNDNYDIGLFQMKSTTIAFDTRRRKETLEGPEKYCAQ